MPFQIPRSRIPQSQTPRPIDTDPLAASRATQRGVAQIGQDIQQIGQSILQIELTQEANAQRKQAQESADRQRETAGIQRGILRDADEKREGRDKVASARAVTATQGEAAGLVQEIENLPIDQVDQDGRDDALAAYLDQLDQSHEERVQNLPERLRPGLEAVYLEQRQRFAAAASQAYESRLAARDQVLENDYYRELGSTVQSPNGAVVAYEAFKSVYPESDRSASLLKDTLIRLSEDGQTDKVLTALEDGTIGSRLGAKESQEVKDSALQQVSRELRIALSPENIRRLSTITPEEALTDFSGAVSNHVEQLLKLQALRKQPGAEKSLTDAGAQIADQTIQDALDMVYQQDSAHKLIGLSLGNAGEPTDFIALPESYTGMTSVYIQADPGRQAILASGDPRLISNLILEDTHKLHYLDPFYASVLNQWWNSGDENAGGLVQRALSIVGEIDRSFNDAFRAPVRSAADAQFRGSLPQSNTGAIYDKLDTNLLKAARGVLEAGIAGRDEDLKKPIDAARAKEINDLIEYVSPEKIVAKTFWPDPDFSRELGDWSRRIGMEAIVKLGPSASKEDILREVKARFHQEWGIPQIGDQVYRRKQPHNVITSLSEFDVYTSIRVLAAEKGFNLDNSPIFEWSDEGIDNSESGWTVTQIDPVTGLRVGMEDQPGKTWVIKPSDILEGPAKDMLDLKEALLDKETSQRILEHYVRRNPEPAPYISSSGTPLRSPTEDSFGNPRYGQFVSDVKHMEYMVRKAEEQAAKIEEKIQYRRILAGDAGWLTNKFVKELRRSLLGEYDQLDLRR